MQRIFVVPQIRFFVPQRGSVAAGWCALSLLAFAAPSLAQTPPAAPAVVATEVKPFEIPPGWRRKTVKGEEVFCKKTAVTGSRFGKEVCMTVAQLEQHERNNAEMRERMQQSLRLCAGGSACTAN